MKCVNRIRVIPPEWGEGLEILKKNLERAKDKEAVQKKIQLYEEGKGKCPNEALYPMKRCETCLALNPTAEIGAVILLSKLLNVMEGKKK